MMSSDEYDAARKVYNGMINKHPKLIVRCLIPPEFEHIGSMPFSQLQSLFDGLYPPGYQWYWQGDFVTELSDEAIAEYIKYGSALPTLLSTMHL